MKSDAIPELSGVVLAQATHPVDMSALGQWPVLQFFAALLTLVGGAYAIFKGMNKPVPPTIAPAIAQASPYEFPNVYLQGPMTQGISLCHEIKNTLERTEQGQQNVVRLMEDANRNQEDHERLLKIIANNQDSTAEKLLQQKSMTETFTKAVERNGELLRAVIDRADALIRRMDERERRIDR